MDLREPAQPQDIRELFGVGDERVRWERALLFFAAPFVSWVVHEFAAIEPGIEVLSSVAGYRARVPIYHPLQEGC